MNLLDRMVCIWYVLERFLYITLTGCPPLPCRCTHAAVASDANHSLEAHVRLAVKKATLRRSHLGALPAVLAAGFEELQPLLGRPAARDNAGLQAIHVRSGRDICEGGCMISRSDV